MKTNFKLNRIGLKTLHRSGSNLILALLHYHPNFFSLTEKFEFDTNDYESLPEAGSAIRPVMVAEESNRYQNFFNHIVENIYEEKTWNDASGSFRAIAKQCTEIAATLFNGSSYYEEEIKYTDIQGDVQKGVITPGHAMFASYNCAALAETIVTGENYEPILTRLLANSIDGKQTTQKIMDVLKANNRVMLEATLPEDELNKITVKKSKYEYYVPAIPTNDHLLINWLFQQGKSMFLGLDNRIKDPAKIENLVIKVPQILDWESEEHYRNYKNHFGPYCDVSFKNHEYDKKCYLVRNPFRVALSLRPPDICVPAPKDMLLLKQIVEQTVNIIEEYKKDIRNGVDSKIIFLEYFLKNLEHEGAEFVNWADPSVEPSISPDMGRLWAHEYGCGLGTGQFNPYEKIDYKRTLNRDIQKFFLSGEYYDIELLNFAKSKLGENLYNYWLYDTQHDYKTNINLT
tara:strand:- start:12227 stop:13600 length:1374 start_codon:yes stop_codon:yes gene_type:complete